MCSSAEPKFVDSVGVGRRELGLDGRGREEGLEEHARRLPPRVDELRRPPLRAGRAGGPACGERRDGEDYRAEERHGVDEVPPVEAASREELPIGTLTP